jgi:hypothetical protein
MCIRPERTLPTAAISLMKIVGHHYTIPVMDKEDTGMIHAFESMDNGGYPTTMIKNHI